MSNLLEEIEEKIEDVIHSQEPGLIAKPPRSTHLLLVIRNIFAGIAAVLFLISLFDISFSSGLKALGYICGTVAYASEILLLTDNFKYKPPFQEMFMEVCFGILYVILGVFYIIK